MEKYYTPKIEDLFIGYECEIYQQKTNKLIKNIDWHTVKIVISNSEFGKSVAINQINGYLKANKIRTKYLTQEDIESLDWKYKGKGVDIWFEKEGEFHQSSWTSYKAILQYGLHDKRMVIKLEDPGYNPTIFNGIIPSINELKTISKLLGI